MMRLARRASLVVVLLLASVGTASAECAWVLWSTLHIPGSSDHVATVAAFASKGECQRDLEKSEAWQDEKRKTNPTRAVQPPSRLYYTCLPDTVDPRGPKGTR